MDHEDLTLEGHDFWDLLKQLVALTYNTHPDERLGIVEQFLTEAYGPDEGQNRYLRIEYTVLRLVAWMELFEDRAIDENW